MTPKLAPPSSGATSLEISSLGGFGALSQAFRSATGGATYGTGFVSGGLGTKLGPFRLKVGTSAADAHPMIARDRSEPDWVEVTASELERRIDREARERLNMTFAEFVTAYREGALPDTLAAAEIRVLVNSLGVPLVQT